FSLSRVFWVQVPACQVLKAFDSTDHADGVSSGGADCCYLVLRRNSGAPWRLRSTESLRNGCTNSQGVGLLEGWTAAHFISFNFFNVSIAFWFFGFSCIDIS